MKYPDYCAVIRTLGKGGEKYLRTLQSLDGQECRPRKILVYIAEGYDLPQETIGKEEYIYCPKGMVAQRSLPFDEVDTEYILFLDDDVYLPADGVKKLFEGLSAQGGDCITPNVFPNERDTPKGKFVKAFFSCTWPHRDKKWAFKIRKSSYYSYNNNPDKEVLLSQSGAGPCVLCSRKAYRAIHFEDERWMDSYRYALGEDQLFYYKLHIYGYKVLVHYNTGIVHLDAGTGRVKDLREANLANQTLRFVVWWRSLYEVADRVGPKSRCVAAFAAASVLSFLSNVVLALFKRQSFYLTCLFQGYRRGWRYVHSEAYRAIPKYDQWRETRHKGEAG